MKRIEVIIRKMAISKIDWRIVIAIIVCITIIEIYALSKGIDGVILTAVIGFFGLILGIGIPKEKVIK